MPSRMISAALSAGRVRLAAFSPRGACHRDVYARVGRDVGRHRAREHHRHVDVGAAISEWRPSVISLTAAFDAP